MKKVWNSELDSRRFRQEIEYMLVYTCRRKGRNLSAELLLVWGERRP